MASSYYVYIMASRSKTLYIGFTGNIRQRLQEHRSGQRGGFTKRYNVTRLVYFERHDDPLAALKREKKLKNIGRATKEKLVERNNPDWAEIDIDEEEGRARCAPPKPERHGTG